VLVVDDELHIRRTLSVVLRANGLDVAVADSAKSALDALTTDRIDLLLLDLLLPDMNGVEICQRLRTWSRLPVIVLSAIGDEEMKVKALRAGADDYVTKPFSVPELLARIGSSLRRIEWESSPPPVIRTGGGAISIDLQQRQVLREGSLVHLTPIEYEILAFLARNAGRVITREQLLGAVLGPTYEDAHGTLRVHMVNLRRKIEDNPARPRVILTEPGIGYRLQLLLDVN
jgi:two-component system KDP operon response regulator KdpE